jgi:ABC-type bacteriocin/lantibiotic exporter with double-glycine peptidase domain
MTGLRIGIILQALSSMIIALAISFSSSWKLSFIVICFVPFMMLMGIIQGKKQGKVDKGKAKGSFTEQGGQV